MERRAPLDAALAAVVAEWERRDVPAWHELSVERARELETDLFTPEEPPPVDVVRDLSFEGPAGEVRVRLYRDADRPTPGLVFYHGGGWTLGTLDSAGDVCRELARRGDCAVVSVDYRLAPEHPFPAALDDAAAALRWVADERDRLGVGESLSVGGTSAGGNLAAAVALRARAALRGDPSWPEIAGQLLLYPLLDPRTDTASYRENADGPFLAPADVTWFWENYCPGPVQRASPYAAPARAAADDLAGLPPAAVVTAGHDPLRDEGLAYADRLSEAGVPVDGRHEPGLAHGFLSMADAVPAVDAALDWVARRVREPPA